MVFAASLFNNYKSSKLSLYSCWPWSFSSWSFLAFLESIWKPAPAATIKIWIDLWIILDAEKKGIIWPNTDMKDTSQYLSLCVGIHITKSRQLEFHEDLSVLETPTVHPIWLKRLLQCSVWNQTKEGVKTTPDPVERCGVDSFSHSYVFLREHSTC